MACNRAAYNCVLRRVAFRRLPINVAGIGSASSPLLRPEGFVALPRRRIRGISFQASGANKETKSDPTSSLINDDISAERWRIKMLFDGECPLCMREVNMLQERNKMYGTIKFVDINLKDYKPEDHQGVDYEMAMGRIHAILSDGTVVRDVEAFRKLYEEVGLGWVYAVTKYEPVATIASAVYGIWAKYRLQITGRPDLEEILKSRRKDQGKHCQDENTCKTHLKL